MGKQSLNQLYTCNFLHDDVANYKLTSNEFSHKTMSKMGNPILTLKVNSKMKPRNFKRRINIYSPKWRYTETRREYPCIVHGLF